MSLNKCQIRKGWYIFWNILKNSVIWDRRSSYYFWFEFNLYIFMQDKIVLGSRLLILFYYNLFIIVVVIVLKCK